MSTTPLDTSMTGVQQSTESHEPVASTTRGGKTATVGRGGLGGGQRYSLPRTPATGSMPPPPSRSPSVTFSEFAFEQIPNASKTKNMLFPKHPEYADPITLGIYHNQALTLSEIRDMKAMFISIASGSRLRRDSTLATDEKTIDEAKNFVTVWAKVLVKYLDLYLLGSATPAPRMYSARTAGAAEQGQKFCTFLENEVDWTKESQIPPDDTTTTSTPVATTSITTPAPAAAGTTTTETATTPATAAHPIVAFTTKNVVDDDARKEFYVLVCEAKQGKRKVKGKETKKPKKPATAKADTAGSSAANTANVETRGSKRKASEELFVVSDEDPIAVDEEEEEEEEELPRGPKRNRR